MTLHRLNAIELDNVLIEAGFPKIDVAGTTSPAGLFIRRTAWAKAMAESGGFYDITSLEPNPNGSIDWGLFQINDKAHKADIGEEGWSHILEPVYNAHLAYDMTQGGKNWSSWGLGLAGWAGSLHDSNIEAWVQIQSAFKKQYDAYPGAIAQAKADAELPGVHLAYLHYGMGGSAQPAKKPDIIRYQNALRVYLTLHLSSGAVAVLNPNGATGYYGHETENMTAAVYRHKAKETNNLSWLKPPITEPGAGMLGVIGLRPVS